jgi:hypothetical protein
MNAHPLVRGLAVSLAVLGLCLPEMALAGSQSTPAAPPPASRAVVDIALADGGVLHGQVVDLQGNNAMGVPVSVKTQDQQIIRTTTVKDGRFTVSGLRGGVYQVAAGQGQGVYRLWTAKAAPPSAQKNAVVYTGAGTLKMLLANPIVVAGVVGTAIAVPIALANSRSSSP